MAWWLNKSQAHLSDPQARLGTNKNNLFVKSEITMTWMHRRVREELIHLPREPREGFSIEETFGLNFKRRKNDVATTEKGISNNPR